MNNNPYSNQSNRKKKDTGKSSAGSALAWIFFFLIFSFAGGFRGFLVLMVFAVLVGVGAALFGKSAKQAAARSTRPNRTPAAYSSPAHSPSDGHLCDPGQHSEEDRSGREALDAMQAGYSRIYEGLSGARGTAQSAGGQMTPEECAKKISDLEGLRNAGIITDAELRQKIREYAAYTR